MPDIVTLTINPSIDIFVNVEQVEPTRKMRCSSPKRDPGGGGINVARVAHRLGGDVAAIYPTGGAIGKLQNLMRKTVFFVQSVPPCAKINPALSSSKTSP